MKLTHKDAPFDFGQEQRKAFDDLKAHLVSPQIMAHPQTNKPYKLYTDACEYCIGAIGLLVQDDENGVECVVQYLSH